MTELGRSGWDRPEPESVIGFTVLFLLFGLAGYVVHSHVRAGRLHWLKTGIVGLSFTIAILCGFAVGLWVLDRLGLYDPYASDPRPLARDTGDGRVVLPDGAEPEPTFTVEQPSREPTLATYD